MAWRGGTPRRVTGSAGSKTDARWAAHRSCEIDGPYVSFIDVLAAEVTLATPDLIAAPRSHAVTMAQEFLHRFGLRIADEIASDWQAELIGRGAEFTR